MKNIFRLTTVFLLFVLTGCQQESCAADTEYEFLTLETVVLKCKTPLVIKKSSVPILRQSVWQKENALVRDAAGKIKNKPDITHFLYLCLGRALQDQETLVLESSGGRVEIRYSAKRPVNIFKLNQVGNGANQPRKYAYMGAWLGSGGALPLKHLAGKKFELRRSSNDICVYRNTLKLRRDDPLFQRREAFTGEEVLELDYSSFKIPGKYYFYVENVGRSMDFVIGSETLNEAFYIHARGLYHKRCGIAKTQPFTAWVTPACHQTVLRGRFPGDDTLYRKRKNRNDSGFFDIKDNPVTVKVFELIKANPPYRKELLSAPGGWHDAADYDRRPYHLRIVSDLATVYLMKPENFIDGQLNLPESGNGIPDILDEAAWGLKHLLAVQQSDGGVGTWFETTSHPGAGEGLPDHDPRTYYLSAPSRNGTLEYAASASTLALAMKKAGAGKEADKFLASAVKAWNFSMAPKNRQISWLRLNRKMISFREPEQLYSRDLLTAGVNLYALTGKKEFLLPLTEARSRLKNDLHKDFWKWSQLAWMTLELFPAEELNELRTAYRNILLQNAAQMLSDQENAYPYRTPWRGGDDNWVHAMAWGSYHPLRRAMTLIAAHKLTGDEKYLAGAYLANDFHNGANPLGRSMTSGLGKIYPAVFLDLISYADGIGEFVPGITPYGNTFGINRNAIKMVYGENAEKLPIFRRYVNLEFLSVPSSEYSVWETISPAAVTSGYLIEKPALPSLELKNRKPVDDFRRLPGFRALP